MASIFVSIANYRDPEVVNTVQALVQNASGQNTLTISVLSQCRPEERQIFPAELSGSKVQIEQCFTDPVRSRGVGWARAEIQRNYSREDFYLQLDSHVQLAPNWDAILCEDYASVSINSPAVLTAYLPGYEIIERRRVVRHERPTEFNISQKNGLPSATARLAQPRTRPRRAFFFSGHFAFAAGRFVEDVPYDQEIFFLGEEISMAVRAYASGYDLYTPSQFVGSHLYRRLATQSRSRPLFWDAEDESQRSLRWTDRDVASKAKVGAICRGEWRGLYGVRSIDRYREFRDALRERYGIDLCGGTVLQPARIVQPEPQSPDPVRRATTSKLMPSSTLPHSRGELCVVGVGISAIAHMTLEGIAAIEAADLVFYNPTSPIMAAKVKQLNPNCFNLYRLYGEGKPRRQTYLQMAELMLREVREGKRVVGVFHGHPGFFVSATRRAMRIAEREGYPARMIPGVSSVDVLCADIGLDPGTFGLQILKASSVLKRRPMVAADGHVVFIQVGAVGDNSFSFTGFKKTRKPEFIQKVIEIYGEEQEAVYYRAAVLPGFPYEKRVAPLRAFADTLADEIQAGILYLPPKGQTLVSVLELQISKGGRGSNSGGELVPVSPLAELAPPLELRESFASAAMLSAVECLAVNAMSLDRFRNNPADFVACAEGLAPDEAEALRKMNFGSIRAAGRRTS